MFQCKVGSDPEESEKCVRACAEVLDSSDILMVDPNTGTTNRLMAGIYHYINIIGGSKGGARDAPPPPGSKFFHFHAVFGKFLSK